jgi:hypothetical protein
MFNHTDSLDNILLENKSEVIKELNQGIPFRIYQKALSFLYQISKKKSPYGVSITVLHDLKKGSKDSKNVYAIYASKNDHKTKDAIDIIKGINPKDARMHIEISYNDFLYGIHNNEEIKSSISSMVKHAWIYRNKIRINGETPGLIKFGDYISKIFTQS